MSEREKILRSNYQKRRKTLIVVQAVIISLLTVALLFSLLTYFKLNRDTYIPYNEDGKVIYKAYLADNEFYSEEYLNGSHAYVASLIEKMTADFSYNLKMQAQKVQFKYSYRIDAQLEVREKETQMAIFNPVYELTAPKTEVVNDNQLAITDSVEIDYNKYNSLARNFINAYGLKDVEATLIVRMYVDVLGNSDAFANISEESYTIELFVPLVKPTVTPYTATTVTNDEQKVLALNNNDTLIYKNAILILALADLVLVAVLVVFSLLTRDKHINYSIKVKRIVSSYKSFIQKVNNELDIANRQVLFVDTFNEMLDIRDTLQMPILMYENDDKTSCQFFIVADSNLVYLYRVSVIDDYSFDFLNGKQEQTTL